VTSISVNPLQPRQHFDESALTELAASIQRHGVLQPLVVRRAGAGFELIAGERRLRAAKAIGLTEVPVVLREADAIGRTEIALIENLQREDLGPLEEAAAYRGLIDDFGLTQEDVAQRVGKSRSSVANSLRLLGLPGPVKAQLESGALSAGHARAVLTIEGADEQIRFARELVDRQVPKADAERIASARRVAPKVGGRKRAAERRGSVDPNVRAVTDQLTSALGTRVRIVSKRRGGRIEIEYYSNEELERLLERLIGTS
jgi:ParB family chromosome partitioning protein